jgi:hypothetical protein
MPPGEKTFSEIVRKEELLRIENNGISCIRSMHMHGLEGVKVLELGTMVSAAYATKLMADLGADVIKVEEPN